MAEKADENHCGSSEYCSPSPSTPMGTPLRRVLDRISGFASPWNRSTTPSGRRIFHRDVEREEFEFASTHCLSSYYSVFVARLAIMVCEILPCTFVLVTCLIFYHINNNMISLSKQSLQLS